jgi:hypothetical protein
MTTAPMSEKRCMGYGFIDGRRVGVARDVGETGSHFLCYETGSHFCAKSEPLRRGHFAALKAHGGAPWALSSGSRSASFWLPVLFLLVSLSV